MRRPYHGSSLKQRIILMGATLLISGCASPLFQSASPTKKEGVTVSETTDQLPQASQISSIDALETNQGIRISLGSDGPLDYKLFRLDSPPRLLLTFPKTRMGASIQPKTLDFKSVTGLFPMENGKNGSRLEITLSTPLNYDIHARKDGLDLSILSKQSPEDQVKTHIEDIRVLQNSDGTHVHLVGSGFFPKAEPFRLNDPPRLVIDYFGLIGPSTSLQRSVTSPEIKAVHLASGAEKTRLIIHLTDQKVLYRIDPDKEIPIIHFSHETTTPSQTMDGIRANNGQQEISNNESQHGPHVKTVHFSREDLNGILKIKLNIDDVIMSTLRQEKQLTLTLKNTTLSEGLSQRLDVQAFGGPVKTVDTYEKGDHTRISMMLSHPGDQHEIIQQGSTILVRIKPVPVDEAKNPLAYTGKKVSMDFKNIDIQNALRMLAEVHKLNILLSDTVAGTITMRLVRVPWNQALDMVLEAKGLGKVLQGNVLRVAPLEEIQAMAKARLETQKSNQQLEPILTEMIAVSFASADGIRTLLMDGDQEKGTRLLSKSGNVSIDPRTNTLIVKDVASNLAEIRKMVKKLDKAIPQVLIEARIVEVQRGDNMDFGINWGFNFKDAANSSLGISNSASNAYTTQQNVTETYERRPRMTDADLPLNVNLMGNAVSNLGFHLGSISPLLDLDIEIGAMESSGKAKTISSPRVLTTDNKSASINQGVSQPYPVQTDNGIGYEYKDATLGLQVTPHVTANGYITLDVTATNNSLGTALPGSPPPVNTKELQTQALVKNGQTIVLGGIFQNSQSDGQSGIPELSKLPFVGWLFKNQSNRSSQSELLIFITPHIINPT